MIIGYARVSTTDQDLTIQKESLLKNGAKFIYEEKKSGKDLSRLALQDCLENLQAYDTLLVTKLDRLSRSTSDTIKLLDTLSKNKIYIKSINDGIDTSTATGKMFAQFLAIMAEHERTCILERTSAGREKAKREGKLTGRPLKISNERVRLVMQDIESGIDIREACSFRGVSVPTFYRRMKRLKET